MADGSKIPAVAVGVFNLCFDSRVLILEDCPYVPNDHRNLISATYLVKHGYCVILKDNVVIKKDKVFICFDNIVDGLYIMTPDKHELYNSELDNNLHVKSLKEKNFLLIVMHIFGIYVWVILIQIGSKDW